MLAGANEMGADPPYRTVLASADGRPVRSGSGVEVAVDASLDRLLRRRGPVDSLVVVGGEGVDRAAADTDLCRGVAELARRARRTVSVCNGALVLAATGLLDGRRATTHWESVGELAERHPSVEVEPDHIYVQDGDVWTSAGVTSGIDLFLALVEADHGAELAHRIARDLVVFVRRPGGQSQFSAQLETQPARSPVIAELQRWMSDHLDDDLTVAALARHVGLSPRQFARAFAAEVGTTPAVYVENVRLEAARRHVGGDTDRRGQMLICPDCLRTRRVPVLRIAGQVPELLLATFDSDGPATALAHATGLVMPFEADIRVA